MMRRILVTLGCSVVLQAVVVTPAHAWWEFIERLSGPGPFTGVSVDARVLCIVAEGDSMRANTPPPLGILTTSCRLEGLRDASGPRQRQLAAVDLGMRFVWKEDDPLFAGGERISLTTIEPSLSINLLSGFTDQWDVVDYGVGIGAYWFSSDAFPSFHGLFVEPVRFEFHAPTRVRMHRWAAAIPRVRVGLLTFPGGFETASFAAAPSVPERISRDTVLNVGIFVDLVPILTELQ
jgi:hypothetical protein